MCELENRIQNYFAILLKKAPYSPIKNYFKVYKINNIAIKRQIRLKKELNRLIYLKNTTNFVVCVIFNKAFRVRL